MQWLLHFWESLTWSGIAFGTLLLILQIIVSYVVIILVMIKLPADYFSSSYAKNQNTDSPFFIRWGGVILKNLVGVLLIIVGIVMIVTPGPGGLTILLGLSLIHI